MLLNGRIKREVDRIKCVDHPRAVKAIKPTELMIIIIAVNQSTSQRFEDTLL